MPVVLFAMRKKRIDVFNKTDMKVTWAIDLAGVVPTRRCRAQAGGKFRESGFLRPAICRQFVGSHTRRVYQI